MGMEFDLSPFWISLRTAFVATSITFFLGIAVAHWMLGHQSKVKGLLDSLFTLPLVLPPTVVGFFLLVVCGKHSPFGQLLEALGISPIFSWTGAVIAATVVAFPLMYKTTLGAFKQIDTNLLYAARTLGASEWTVFWQVTLPLAWQGIVAGTILAFARALGEFGATLMLAGNIPGETQTIPVAIFFAAEGGQMHLACAWVLVIMAISLAVIVALDYFSGSKELVVGKGFWHLNSQFWHFLQSKIAAVSFLQSRRCSRRQTRKPAEAFLQMQIEKQNQDFALAVALTAGKDPLGLLGGSGSGKSMTLRCLAGLETPTQGRITLNGRVLFDSQKGINLPSRQRQIGVVFQNYALFPHMTVAENIAFGLHCGFQSAPLSKAELKQRVAEKIALVQLQGLENRYPHQLSGGQQQRVALARALAIEPEALLLDEPFSALDTHLRNQIEKQLVETLAAYQGVTLFVTHNLEEAYRVCDRLLVLSAGREIAYGPKAEIFERPGTSTVAQLTECKNISRARTISPTQVEAVDWGCKMQAIEAIPDPLAYVGIRAHHITVTSDRAGENSFPSWLVQTSETPHRMTLYLKLNSPPANCKDYHLQAEISKEKWAILKDRPFPWNIYLDPLRLFLMNA